MKEALKHILPDLRAIRHHLHQNPELSQKEYKTSKWVLEYLQKHTKAKTCIVAGTGVIAIFDSTKKGKDILLRADIDALPISEINEFEHKSTVQGVSHKCGHDGHTVMLLGVARMLEEQPIENGKVVLLFQPAEEVGKGAEAVLNDPIFQDWSFDFVFALHNLPGFKKNQIVVKENVFNATVKSLIIKLQGRTAHAAEPEKGENPSYAIAEIIQFAKALNHNFPEKDDFFLITPVHINIGEMAYGVSAGSGEIHLTIRSWDLDLFDQKCDQLLELVENECAKYSLSYDSSWTEVFYTNKNSSQANDYIRLAANRNNFEINEMSHSFKWGEDFGLFTQIYKGAMFGLGAGVDTPALHNPDYDFPDDIIETGIQQFYQIIQEITTD